MKEYKVSWKLQGVYVVPAKDISRAATEVRKRIKEAPNVFVADSVIEAIKVTAVEEITG